MDWPAFDAARNIAADRIRSEHAFESTTSTEAILLMLVDMLSAELKMLGEHVHETHMHADTTTGPLDPSIL